MMRVSLGERSYGIVIATSYAGLPAAVRPLGLYPRGWLLTHPSLAKRYGAEVLRRLRGDGWRIHTITVPESERSKSLAAASRIMTQLARAPGGTPTLFALGGGVVGDLAGFVAAVYRRGVPYIQLPTTLLAQVDSSIGGKTGVDLPEGKNLVGAYHQPRLVYHNLAVLASLPLRQRRSGIGEIIKYGLMADPALFRLLETRMPSCVALQPSIARALIERSCRIKARVVSQDERERRDVRIRLNLGHTIGHALEAATGYARFTHGEAIAIGMCAAAEIAVRMGRLAPQARDRLVRVIERAGLPTTAAGVDATAVRRAMRGDKKITRGVPRWVLPVSIGRVQVTEDVPARVVEAALAVVLRRPRRARR